MARKPTNKINKIRTFALLLVFIGIVIMYIGIFFPSPLLMSSTMALGFLCVIGSTVVYFWIGMLSTKTVQVTCPECNKTTKMLGRVDACSFCSAPLTLDPALEGKDFDEKYNKKS